MYNRFIYIFLVFIFREDFSFLWKDTGSHRYKRIVTEALYFFIILKILSSGYVAVETSADKVNSSWMEKFFTDSFEAWRTCWNCIKFILKLFDLWHIVKKLVWFRVHSPKYSWVLATPFSGRVLGLHCNRNDVTCQLWMLDSFVVNKRPTNVSYK